MPNMRSFKRRLQHLRYPSGASACTQCSASSSSLPATTSSYATACQQPSSSSPVDNLIPLWACLGAIGALVLGVLIGWQCQPQHQGPEYGRTKPDLMTADPKKQLETAEPPDLDGVNEPVPQFDPPVPPKLQLNPVSSPPQHPGQSPLNSCS